jgi:hypothetical protein
MDESPQIFDKLDTYTGDSRRQFRRTQGSNPSLADVLVREELVEWAMAA